MDEVAYRGVTVSGPSSEPAITERATGRDEDFPPAGPARVRATALAVHRTASKIAEGVGAGEAGVVARVGSRTVSHRASDRERRRTSGGTSGGESRRADGAAGGEEPVRRIRLETLVQIQVPTPGRPVPLLWQWAGADPVAALRSAAAQVAGELRAASAAVPLEAEFTGTVVLAPEVAVHFVHETLGHSLEADNYRDYAARSGLELGTRVGTEALTVLDGPAEGLETSYRCDDEGTLATATPLVDAGTVAGVMTDAAEAARQGLPRTGNGRRSFGAELVQPRMSALRVAVGATPSADLIRSVRRGLYCRGAWGGGSVEEMFVVRPAYAEWIEDGELTGVLVRRLDIKGRKTAALRELREVADDPVVFNPVTGCGKNGQELPVSVESPSMAFGRLTVMPMRGASAN
ncbi:metallopeptidase TldD-related protein [Streptomyces sp. NPDC056909]|uniref:metallopeptidase TldD-related protein n=1 Tax=Streptomyces sp. NPDC056909 TaxID=3345963 RepID=UPI003683D52F